MVETNDTHARVQPTPKEILLTEEPTVYEIQYGTLTSRIQLIAAIAFDGCKRDEDSILERADWIQIDPPMEAELLDDIAEKLLSIEIQGRKATAFILETETDEKGVFGEVYIVRDGEWVRVKSYQSGIGFKEQYDASIEDDT